MSLLKIKLEKKLEKAVDEFHGIMGIAIEDLATGEEIVLNGDEAFPIASSIKIAILLEFLNQAESGEVRPDGLLTLTKELRVGGSGVLKELADGKVTMSLLDYATLMITVSDNTATNICIDQVGMERINETLAKLGLATTRLVHQMMDLESVASGMENVSTPREMMTLMGCIYRRRGIKERVCERTLEILKKSKEGLIEGVIRNSVPDSIPVADKSGWVEGAICDAGIVFLPRRPYTIAVLAKHIPEIDPKKLGAIREMTRVTRIVHDYFREIDASTPHGRRISS